MSVAFDPGDYAWGDPNYRISWTRANAFLFVIYVNWLGDGRFLIRLLASGTLGPLEQQQWEFRPEADGSRLLAILEEAMRCADERVRAWKACRGRS
jgi:hypothetical protein